MKHAVKHDLDQAQAKLATEKAFDAYRERFAKYNPSFAWASDKEGKFAFEVKGMKLDGEVALKPGQIEIDLSVPFLLKPFQGKAIDVIDGEIQKWVAKAKAGEI